MMITMILTLSVEEVIHENVVSGGGLEGGILKRVLLATRTITHILLTKSLRVIAEVVDVLRLAVRTPSST